MVEIKKNPNKGWSEYINKDWDVVKHILELDQPLDLMILKTRQKRSKIVDIIKRANMEDFIEESLVDKYIDSSVDSDSHSSEPTYNTI